MAENLYCPRCSKPFAAEISYCRTCGLELDGVAKIVRGDDEYIPAKRERAGVTAFGVGLGLFIVGLVIGILNGVVREFDLFPEKYGKLVFFLLIAAGLLTIGYSAVFQVTRLARSSQRKKRENTGHAPLETAPLGAGELPAADTNEIVFPVNKREPVMAEPGTVTDATTRNLE